MYRIILEKDSWDSCVMIVGVSLKFRDSRHIVQLGLINVKTNKIMSIILNSLLPLFT